MVVHVQTNTINLRILLYKSLVLQNYPSSCPDVPYLAGKVNHTMDEILTIYYFWHVDSCGYLTLYSFWDMNDDVCMRGEAEDEDSSTSNTSILLYT